MLDTAAPLTMVLAETTGTDTITYLHGLELVAQSDGVSTEYFVNDGLGSVRQLVDPVGEVLLAQTYDPYGSLYASAGVDATAFGYAGEQEDASGLVFLRARYYSPSMGRFLNMDPSRQEMNPYQYGLGSPLNYTDPTGLEATYHVLRTLINSSSSGIFSYSSRQTTSTSSRYSVDYMHGICIFNREPIGQTNGESNVSTYATLFFGGSDVTKGVSSPGPDPAYQTPVWVEIANQAVQYPGSKWGQASSVVGYDYSNVRVIGYSAGADAAVMFADDYRRNNTGFGRITDLVILGGTMSGTMGNGTKLQNNWRSILRDLLNYGTDIYVLNDSAPSDPAWWTFNPRNTAGTYTYFKRNKIHEDPVSGPGVGTNNDPALVAEVLAWFDNY